VAEPDAAGMGGALGGGDDAASAVFRGRTKVEIDYKDVTGLTKQMNSLADAIKRVKSGLESLNSSKAQKALKDLQGATGGGGGGFGGGTPNGGNSTYASSGGGGGADEGKGNTGRGFGGLSKTQYAVAGTVAAIGALSNAYMGRQQADLMSDVTAMRTVYTSDSPKFGLRQATSYNAAQFGPYSLNREDALQGAGAIAGRYGGQGSASAMRAASGTGAYAMGSFQGSAFGADMYNQLNAPQALNAMRAFGGPSTAQIQPVAAANAMARIAFGSETPTNAQLNNFRPGMNQYNNMLAVTGGNAGLASMQVELMRARQRYEAVGSPRGAWSEDTLKSIGKDKGLQKELFGEGSLYISRQQFESGKGMRSEDLLNLSRSGLVSSNELLADVSSTMHDMLKEIQKYSGPLGNFLGSIGGGGAGGLLSSGLDILQTVALLGGGKKGGNAVTKALGGAASKIGSKLPGGGTMLGYGAKVGSGVLGTAVAADEVNTRLGGQEDKGFLRNTWDNISAPFTGGWEGWEVGIPGIGDPVGGGRPGLGVGDPVPSGAVGGAGAGGMMSVSQAEALIRSRGGATDQISGLASDLKVKLGRLFAMNPKLSLSSGARSRAGQEKIYRERYRPPYPGAPLDAPGWKHISGAPAAKPGKSNHEYGVAADIGPESQYGWLAKNAPGVGLVKPMSYEPWHWEPPGAKSRRGAGGAAAGNMNDMQADSGQAAEQGGGGIIGAMVRRVTSMGGVGMGAPGGAASLSGLAISPAGATGTQVGATGGATGGGSVGGAISINEAANAARAAGIPESALATALSIMMAESGGIPGRINDKNTNGSIDRGLWQINSIHSQYDPIRLLDPNYNAKAMADLSSGGTNWKPWVAYNEGHNKKFLSQVNQALSTGVGDPVDSGSGGAGHSSVPAMMSVGTAGGGTKVYAPINITMMEASDAEIYRVAVAVKNTIEGVINDVDTARTGG
jgi:hypothetical protein